jgi:hypothetical protein
MQDSWRRSLLMPNHSVSPNCESQLEKQVLFTVLWTENNMILTVMYEVSVIIGFSNISHLSEVINVRSVNISNKAG